MQSTLVLRCEPHTAHRELSEASFSPETREDWATGGSPHTAHQHRPPTPKAMTSGTDAGQEGPIRLDKGGDLEQSVLREGL